MKLAKLCNRLFIFFLAIAGVIACHETFLQIHGWIFLAILPPVLLGIWSVKRAGKMKKELPYNRIWWIVQGLALVAMVITAFSLRVQLTWDWGYCIEVAERFNREGITNVEYFSRYSNLQFWEAFLIFVAGIARFFCRDMDLMAFYKITIVMSCIFTNLSLLVLHKTAVLLWEEKKGFFTGCVAAACLPLYMWSMYAYTDTSSMLMMLLILYFFIKSRKEEKSGKRMFCYGCMGFFAALAWKIKVTVFIVVIAIVITLLICLMTAGSKEKWIRFLKEMAVLALVFVAVIAGTGKMTQATLSFSAEDKERYEFPLTHWVMMGLVYGGYVDEDVTFTKSFPSVQEKKEANIRVIKERLEERGTLRTLWYLLYTKQIRTWGDGTYASSDYSSRKPWTDQNIIRDTVPYGSPHNKGYLIYTGIYHILILLGMVLSGIFAMKKQPEQQWMFAGRLGMLGLTIFLMIWETNSRYLVAYMLLMVLVAMDGYLGLYERFVKARR